MHASTILSYFLWNLSTSQEEYERIFRTFLVSLFVSFGFLFVWMAPVSLSLLWSWTWEWTWSKWHQFPGCLFWSSVQWILWKRSTGWTAFKICGKGLERWEFRNYIFLQIVLLPSFVNPVFWPLLHSLESPWSSQSLLVGRTACVSSSTSTVRDRLRSWTNTNSSSWVSTSPLAINTTLGVPRFCNFLLFWAFFFFAHHLRWCSWIENLRSSGPGWSCRHPLRSWNSSRCYAKSPDALRAHLYCCKVCSCDLLEFRRAKTTLMKRTFFTDFFRQKFFKNLTVCYDPNLPGSRWKDFLGK